MYASIKLVPWGYNHLVPVVPVVVLPVVVSAFNPNSLLE